MSFTEIRHYHGFCGVGSGAAGFNDARPRVGQLAGDMVCIGGFDVDERCVRDFKRMTGAEATQLDAFSLEQYIAFNDGKRPPPGWREATAADIHRSAGHKRPHIVFLSSPCKGLSGLLSQKLSTTPRYVALNELTLRGVWLMLEAWSDDPPELVLFENVPRIATRGRHLLDQIVALLRHYGYVVNETTHDCGEIGELAQSRKRFLLVARHERKVPAFLYQPERRPLQPVGSVLGRILLPGDERAGPMHRVPNLQWKTWVRLAFVEAGSDWRSLNKLAVEDGKLRDYLLMPDDDRAWHPNVLGVNAWDAPTGTVTSEGRPTTGRFAVSDPRAFNSREGTGFLGVRAWDSHTGAVTANGRPGAGAFSVQDPRVDQSPQWNHGQQYGVNSWNAPAGTVTGQQWPNQGRFAVQDPRLPPADGRHESKYRITRWDRSSHTVSGSQQVGSGAACVADPRHAGPAKHNNEFRIVRWDREASTVTGAHGTGQCVADPRPDWDRRGNNLVVENWDEPSHTVIAGGKGVQGGWLSVADPRPGMRREKGDHYLTGGHYGVVPWTDYAGAVSASASHDNGPWSVADPRPMPSADQKLVARIRSLDGTWHRPFTTLELAALQSMYDPEEHLETADRVAFKLEGTSDTRHREAIGNAVPRKAAKAIGEVMGQTLLLAWSGETFSLSATPIWVRNVAIGISFERGDGL